MQSSRKSILLSCFFFFLLRINGTRRVRGGDNLSRQKLPRSPSAGKKGGQKPPETTVFQAKTAKTRNRKQPRQTSRNARQLAFPVIALPALSDVQKHRKRNQTFFPDCSGQQSDKMLLIASSSFAITFAFLAAAVAAGPGLSHHIRAPWWRRRPL